jgi:hypothetical protein
MSNKKSDNIFPPHLYEPIRREIATCYAQHEFRKLLPQLRDISLWQSIDKQIKDWYEELSERNFWNAIHGISMGFRLKSLVPLITSLNINWEKKDMAPEDIWFGGKFGPISSLKSSELGFDVKEKIFQSQNINILEQTQKKLKDLSSETSPRDEFPIFVVLKEEKLRVIDGNRRLLQAIVERKKKIKVFVGRPIAQPLFFEHWVPTSLLVDLVFWHKKQFKMGRETTDTIAKTIVELIRDSSAGRTEFIERSVHKDDEIHQRLVKAVTKILTEHNISFKILK